MANNMENTSGNDTGFSVCEQNNIQTSTHLLRTGEDETITLPLNNLPSMGDNTMIHSDIVSPQYLSMVNFREKYLRQHTELTDQNRSFKTKLKQFVKRKCNRGYLGHSILSSFPVFGFVKRYNIRTDLASDIVAGLSVGIVQIPSSMAFAMLASLPPICGLYTAFISAVVYFLFGTSNYVSVGSTATVSLIVGTAVEKNEEAFLEFLGNTSTNATFSDMSSIVESSGKIAAATTLTFLGGSFLIILGKLRFGIVTSYMPDPMLSGFLTSAMILVIVSQIKVVLGIQLIKQQQPFKPFKELVEVGKNIPSTNIASLVTAVICLIVIYVVKVCVNQRYKKRLPFPLPIELVVVAAGTIISHFTDLNTKFDLNIVGDIPSGLPSPQLPPLQKTSMSMISDAVTVAVVAYVISVSIAKSLSKEKHEYIDSNQEMVAVGASSLAASLLSGFAVGVSLSRSVVQKSAGGKTQVASVIGSVVVLVVILFIGPLFYSLPDAVLAAVILVAFRGVVTQVLLARKHWNVSKHDFTMWAVTFTGVLCFGVNIGLLLGVLVSILSVIVRTQRSQFVHLNRIEDSNTFVNEEVYQCVDEFKGKIQVIYFQGPLYFANAEFFTTRLRKLIVKPESSCEHILERTSPVGCFGKKKRSEPKIPPLAPPDGEMTRMNDNSSQIPSQDTASFVILDCSGITFADQSGVTALEQSISGLEEEGTVLYLACVRDELIEVMIKTNIWEEIKARMFLTITGAKQHAENI